MGKTKKVEKPKILITGGMGFIAGHVAEEAHKQGYEVYVLARHNSYNPKYNKHLIDIEAQVYLGDIRDKTFVSRAVSLVDGVINLAGILGTQETIDDPFPSVETNILGALNVFQACRQFQKPCVQISVGNYFMNNSYALSKYCAEGFAKMYSIEHGTPINIVRGLNAYGERQKANPIKKIIPQFVTRALKGEDLTVNGQGEPIMDMIYVKDLAKILLEVLSKTSNPEDRLHKGGYVLDAGTGRGHKIKDIAEMVIEKTKSKSKIKLKGRRPGESEKSIVVAEKPYKFNYTSLEEGLDKTIKWYKSFMDEYGG